MPRDIAALCKACPLCKATAVRRSHLSGSFQARKLENLPMPRQSYGIDFYGVPKGEILVIVDLCTRETILVFMTSRNQDKVARALLSQIIFSRGVPTTLRSDSAPELVAGWVADINAYLGIDQVRTGGYNPRGNAVCERANQTIGAMLRKCSDEQYKNIENYLPAMAFAMNCTYSSTLNCTPFEAGHGLPARTIAQARSDSSRIQFDAGGNDDAVQDVSKRFDPSQQKEILELATRLATAAHQESEWHRRLTSLHLNKAGKATASAHLQPGAKVWFYKPPDHNQVMTTGRKVKHLAHYHGPATITEKIGASGYKFEFNGKTFQREAGMLVPYTHMPASFTIDEDAVKRKPRLHHLSMQFREGEFIITKDDPAANDWYCAEVSRVLTDRLELNYYTTVTQPLDDYPTTSIASRTKRLGEASFLRTWCLQMGAGKATTQPPKQAHRLAKDVYSGQIPLREIHEHVLIRDVKLNALGVLDNATTRLATALSIPHHAGAGGEDDFL